MTRQRILITGANGYIGARLAANLASEHDVYCVIRPGSALPAGTPIAADLSQPFDPVGWPARLDKVVHLAQSSRYREFPNGADDMFGVNVHATAILLEYSRRAECQHFLLASSGNVYEPFAGPLTEDQPLRPKSYYAASKVAAEALIHPYQEFFPTTALRFFGPYGPQQRDRLIPNLATRLRRGEAVHLDGTSEGSVFAFVYIDDLLSVIEEAVMARWAGPFNVAAPEQVSMRTLADALGRHLNVSPQYQLHSERKALRIVPDLSRLASVCDMTRLRDIQAGLATLFSDTPDAAHGISAGKEPKRVSQRTDEDR
jgi:UDP-glucose 4-epimerase